MRRGVNGTAASEYEQEEYVLYGTYEPRPSPSHISLTISPVSPSHPIATPASGRSAGRCVGAETFNGYYDNTEVYFKLAELLDIE